MGLTDLDFCAKEQKKNKTKAVAKRRVLLIVGNVSSNVTREGKIMYRKQKTRSVQLRVVRLTRTLVSPHWGTDWNLFESR